MPDKKNYFDRIGYVYFTFINNKIYLYYPSNNYMSTTLRFILLTLISFLVAMTETHNLYTGRGFVLMQSLYVLYSIYPCHIILGYFITVHYIYKSMCVFAFQYKYTHVVCLVYLGYTVM